MSRKNEPSLGTPNVRVDSAEAAKLRQSLPQGADNPGGMKRIICLSPLAKIFQPYSDIEQYLEAPETVYNENDFDVVFESSWATKSYKYGESYLVTELEALYLVGIDNNRFERATGGTGFVYFNVPDDLLATFSYMRKTGKKVDADLSAQLDAYLGEAKALSNRRVLDFMKDKYNLMFMNRQNMEAQGGKASMPNDMEILITFVLNEEIKKSSDKRRKLRQAWELANKEIHGH